MVAIHISNHFQKSDFNQMYLKKKNLETVIHMVRRAVCHGCVSQLFC